MKKTSYYCNICGESEANCTELIGVKHAEDDSTGFEYAKLNVADIHLCPDCINELRVLLGVKNERE